MSANVEVVKRGYAEVNAAYQRNSVDELGRAMADAWHEDGVLETSGRLFPEAGEWSGRDGFLHFLRQQMEAFERQWVEPLDFIENGDTILVPVRLGGTARHTGIEMEFEFFHLFELRDGRISRLVAMVDRDEAFSKLGARGSPANE